jgi:hypothetical protein
MSRTHPYGEPMKNPSLCPTISTLNTTRRPLEGFSRNFTQEIFKSNYRDTSIFA